MRKILAIAWKELLVLMGSRKSRFMVLIPPVIQLFLFAWAATMEVKNVDVVVQNQDSGVWSQEVIRRLRGSTTFRHLLFVDNPKQAEEALNRQDVLMVVVFQNDFSRTILAGGTGQVQLLLDGRRSNAAQIVAQYLEQIVRDVANTVLDGNKQGGVQVDIRPINWFNPNLDFQWFILPNLIGTINFIMGILITGLTVARERELGTFDQMLVSPAESVDIAVGKLIPGCVIGLVHGTIFFVSARWFFGVPFEGSIVVLYVSMLLFSLAVCSLGLMVSSFATTQQQAFLGCFTIAVPCILLSGFMTPVNNMPMFLQNLSQLNPLRHFIVILQGLFLKDISLPAALDSGARIAGITLVSVLLAIWMFKRKA
ncbi:MAG: ABC transporter permease [Bilophila sp.]